MNPVTTDGMAGRNRQRGMTLAAVLVGLAVGTLVLAAALRIYLMISEGARDTLMRARLDQELRAALDVMQADIRRAGYWDFADLGRDSDADGSGTLEWSDLGTKADGSGTFDTDGDGDTDALDLTPINNPFQRRYGKINNDLCIGTNAATGDCVAPVCSASQASGDCLSSVQQGSCLTYSYDLDADGRVGIRACDKGETEKDCPRPAAAPSGAPFDARRDEPYAWRSWYPPNAKRPAKSIEMEMFGFRYRNSAIEMRVGRTGDGDISFGCTSGRWERITSPDIEITRLQFTLTTAPRNANPDKARTDPCADRRPLPAGPLGRDRHRRPSRRRPRDDRGSLNARRHSQRPLRANAMKPGGRPMYPRKPRLPRHQAGSMTLLFGLLLLVGAGILTFSAARTGVVEQRIATNEQDAIEAQQAASAGLEFALAWLAKNLWTPGTEAPTPPPSVAANGQEFTTRLTFARQANAICVRSQARSSIDPNITAVARECFIQTGLFDTATETTMPPPLVLAGCMATPTEAAELFVASETARAVASGEVANTACLPQGSLRVATWRDRDLNRVLTPDEKGASTTYRRGYFTGCPGAHCAWDRIFAMPLAEAKHRAEQAGHVFSAGIPCGATAAPGIYLIKRQGSIGSLDITGSCFGEDGVGSHTIGTPSKPVLLIVPTDSGCPSFERDIAIHGIVYFESDSACAAQGWGGAKIQGAVIWEGSTGAPGAGTQFIATDYGAGSELNSAFQVVTGASRLPGTWRDWD